MGLPYKRIGAEVRNATKATTGSLGTSMGVQPSKSPWGKHRAGRCSEIPTDGENARCGYPQSKLNALVRPIMGHGEKNFFSDNLSVWTKTGYCCTWGRWVDISDHCGHGCWINPDAGEQWVANLLVFLLFRHKVMQRKAATLRAKVSDIST